MVDTYLRDMSVWSQWCPEKCWLSKERLEGTINVSPRVFLISHFMGVNTEYVGVWFRKHFSALKRKYVEENMWILSCLVRRNQGITSARNFYPS